MIFAHGKCKGNYETHSVRALCVCFDAYILCACVPACVPACLRVCVTACMHRKYRLLLVSLINEYCWLFASFFYWLFSSN